ncbi:hypothetical protein AWN65_09690 [Flavobacterium covae]|nr:hypothetical protein AWN65_09690 [Flavobacterium covae]
MGNIKKTCMIRYLVIVLLINAIGCKSQEKKQLQIIKANNMEINDERILRDLIGKQTGDFVTLSNGNNAQYFDAGDKINYIFRIKDKIFPVTYVKIYYIKTKTIHIESQDFYGFPIGILKEYDESGKLIKEIDYDKDFKFSIEDLCKLIKSEYDIDLMIKPNSNDSRAVQYNVGRGKSEFAKGFVANCYTVQFYIQDGGGDKMLVIDGNTGEILFETQRGGFGIEALPKNKRIKILSKEEFEKNRK